MSGSGLATVTDLFEAQARRTPEAPAVVAGDEVLSYHELDRRANRVAWDLQRLGVTADVPVAVLVERSIEMTVGVVAVLKAGGACMPIDPSVPGDRVAHLLGDSGAPVILTQQRFRELIGRHPVVPVWLDRDDRDEREGVGGAEGAPPRWTVPEDLGYVIYTSGLTGAPKGVMLTHRGLVNHHLAVAELYQLAPGDRVLQFCSPSFDVSIEEMFPTWAVGATVVLRDDDQPILGRSWLEWLRRQRITVLNLPTAYWHEWVRDLQRLGQAPPDAVRLVIVGGEKALGRAWRAWRRIADGGGPLDQRLRSHRGHDPGHVVRGRPGGRRRRGLGRPSDRPAAGQHRGLCCRRRRPPRGRGDGGGAVPRGAGHRSRVPEPPEADGGPVCCRPLRRPARIPLLSHGRPGEGPPRWDLGVLLPARSASQDPRIPRRVRRGRGGAAGSPRRGGCRRGGPGGHPWRGRLVGYVVADEPGPVSGRELRRFLCDRLPAFMVPSAFVVLAAFPTTATGKVDRDALPAPARSGDGAQNPPCDPIEEVLAAIWAEVLCVDSLGVDDDFFDLGGHSLLATQVIAEVRESLGVELLPSGASRRIASRPLTVPRERYQDLRHLARAAQATVFVVTVAALNVVLNAAGGATDVVVSTTLSGRQRAEWDGVIGYFANVGRIRTDLSGPLTFTDVVRRTRRSVLGLFQHQDIPFSVLDDGCQLWGEVNYKMDFYDQATVEGLARGLEWVLRAVSATPHARLSDLAAGVADALAAAGERGAATGSEHREVGTWRFDR